MIEVHNDSIMGSVRLSNSLKSCDRLSAPRIMQPGGTSNNVNVSSSTDPSPNFNLYNGANSFLTALLRSAQSSGDCSYTHNCMEGADKYNAIKTTNPLKRKRISSTNEAAQVSNMNCSEGQDVNTSAKICVSSRRLDKDIVTSQSHQRTIPYRPTQPLTVFPGHCPLSDFEYSRLSTQHQHSISSPLVLRNKIANSLRISCQNMNTMGSSPNVHSNITTVTFTHPNVTQKSYRNEKRFLCPPPCLKVENSGISLRRSTVEVFRGDSSRDSTSRSSAPGRKKTHDIPSQGLILRPCGKGYFKRLYMDAHVHKKSKSLFLQVSLLQGEPLDINRSRSGATCQDRMPILRNTQFLPKIFTFDALPITVVSKPSRTSVRAQGSNTTVQNGSTICLYNRMNSQTTRTKYLDVHTQEGGDHNSENYLKKRLVTHPKTSGNFTLELLAWPVNDASTDETADVASKPEDWKITYGSIICLREATTQFCSDPMMICETVKGNVKMPQIFSGQKLGNFTFKIKHRNPDIARDILLRYSHSSSNMKAKAMERTPKGQLGNASCIRTSSRSTDIYSSQALTAERNGLDHIEYVSPLQKVALLLVNVTQSCHSPNEVTCDLSMPRFYLCSGASRHPHGHFPNADLENSKTQQVQQTGVNVSIDVEKKKAAYLGFSHQEGKHFNSVGFCSTSLKTPGNSEGIIDSLGDQFCWTLVTTCTCLKKSLLDADSSSAQTAWSFVEADLNFLRLDPRIPRLSLPVISLPNLVSKPQYDPRTHSLEMNVKNFFYEDVGSLCSSMSCSSSSSYWDNRPSHEVWLAHDFPLPTRTISMDTFNAHISCKLPSISKMVSAHRNIMHQNHFTSTVAFIHLPLFFVNVNQGISFLTGYILFAKPSQVNSIPDSSENSQSWSFKIIKHDHA